jgi:hypothetical protein
MFLVEELTGAVTLNQGDTGSYEIEAERDDGEPWTEYDRMTWCLKMGDDVILERVYRLDNPDEDDTLANGVVRIEFTNAQTKALSPGSYTWEPRFMIGAYMADGRVISGDGVDTPGLDGQGEPMPFNVKPVQYRT